MDEAAAFGWVILVVAGAFYVALLATTLSRRVPIPSPALFLGAAVAATALFPALEEHVSVKTAERVAVVALVLIVFDGVMSIGTRRFRASLAPIAWLGVLGTFATAGAAALAARLLLDLDWTTAGLIGAALAPTDPAVTFSVLGGREIGGRTRTILEGESGVNDPVGIALMIALLEFATGDDGSFWAVGQEFAVQMAIGLVVGLAGAAALVPLLRRIRFPREGLYPLQTLAAAGVVYAVATLAHGSGFLAVFVAGILLGDLELTHKRAIEGFHSSLAGLAEIAVFAAFGVTVARGELHEASTWFDGLALAVLLAFVIRPAVIGALLVPVRLRVGEKLFVMWGGLKGAVPLFLAALAVLAGAEHAGKVYDIVLVSVLFSVILQGGTIPLAARRLGVPIEEGKPQ